MAKKLPVFGIGIASVLTVFAVLSTLTVFDAINKIDETNKFISDNTKTPIEYVDETTLTSESEGVQVYRLEAEKAEFKGLSSAGANNLTHACPGASFKFSEEFSGGVALQNIFSSPSLDNANQLVFSVKSDKNVKLNAIIRCGGGTSTSSTTAFGITDVYSIKVNNRLVSLTGNIPVSTEGKLVNINAILPITEGDNDIIISTKAFSSSVTGVIDYIELNTTAAITDFVEHSWDMSKYTITLPPMSERLGKAEYVCDECNNTYVVDTLPSISRGLEIGMYEEKVKQEDGSEIKEYYFKNSDKLVSSDPLPKTIQHKLTIQSEYVTFEDGSQTADVWEFYEFPKVVDTIDKYHVAGWYNVKNKSQVWSANEFAMPTSDITVAPYFDADEYKQDLEQAEYQSFNEGKPKEEWANSPLYSTFNGKVELNDRSQSYKPIHSNAINGFSQGKLANNVTDAVIFDANSYDEKGTLFSYDGVQKDWTFLTCASCNLSPSNPKTFKVRMFNQGSSTLSFDFWFSTASSNPTANGANPHKSSIILNPNETLNFELDVKFSNSNILSYFKFNDNASQMRLVLSYYVESVSTAPEHNVTIKNVEGSEYTVKFASGNTTKVKEGKYLPDLVVNAPADHILDSFFINDNKEDTISASAFVMGKQDITLTPIFRYKSGERPDLTDSGANGKNYIFSSTGLKGFDYKVLSNGMKNEIVLKGAGTAKAYYELATLFTYAGGMSDTTSDYTFVHMCALRVSGKYNITYNLFNDGTETLKFTVTQTNASSAFANASNAKSDLIELAPGEYTTVILTMSLGNASVLTYYDFDCHTTSDLRLYVTEYFTLA